MSDDATLPEGPSDSGVRDVLANRSAVALLLAMTLATMASTAQFTALGKFVFDSTRRPLDLGLIGLAEFLHEIAAAPRAPESHVAAAAARRTRRRGRRGRRRRLRGDAHRAALPLALMAPVRVHSESVSQLDEGNFNLLRIMTKIR